MSFLFIEFESQFWVRVNLAWHWTRRFVGRPLKGIAGGLRTICSRLLKCGKLWMKEIHKQSPLQLYVWFESNSLDQFDHLTSSSVCVFSASLKLVKMSSIPAVIVYWRKKLIPFFRPINVMNKWVNVMDKQMLWLCKRTYKNKHFFLAW